MAIYVLVHGAWGGGWFYRQVANGLRAAGHEVFVPTLTGLGERSHLAHPGITLSDHIQDVLGVLEAEQLEDVILCGHSYGGMVITGVASLAGARIRTLVYLDAFLPQEGEALWDIADDDGRRHYIDGQRETPGLIVPFDGNVPPGQRRIGRHPLLTLTEPVRMSGEEGRIANRTYIYATRDAPTVFTKFYDRVRSDPAWRTVEVPTGHLVMADDPELLTRTLLEEADR